MWNNEKPAPVGAGFLLSRTAAGIMAQSCQIFYAFSYAVDARQNMGYPVSNGSMLNMSIAQAAVYPILWYNLTKLLVNLSKYPFDAWQREKKDVFCN